MHMSRLSLCIHATIAVASVLEPRAADCECFLTNGSHPAYYTDHVFFDFRALSNDVSVPDVVTDYSKSSEASVASEYFKRDTWADFWMLQGWDNENKGGHGLSGDATVKMINSPSNVYIQDNDDQDPSSDTFLTMRTKRLPKFQTAAEFESADEFQFLSVRMLARTIGGPGAITALFTYRDADALADVQEADIEILTRGPRDRISYTNQPSYTEDGDEKPEATRNATLPNGALWSDWVVHRLDWTPEASVWYVDGAEAARIAYQTPKDGAQVILNAWSDGGSWSGKMPIHDEAYLQIQWIEMVYNRTSSGNEDNGDADGSKLRTRRRDLAGPEGRLVQREDQGGCGVVCTIDDTSRVGEAAVMDEGEASEARLSWFGASITLIAFTAALL